MRRVWSGQDGRGWARVINTEQVGSKIHLELGMIELYTEYFVALARNAKMKKEKNLVFDRGPEQYNVMSS